MRVWALQSISDTRVVAYGTGDVVGEVKRPLFSHPWLRWLKTRKYVVRLDSGRLVECYCVLKVGAEIPLMEAGEFVVLGDEECAL
jgi:hypothetical protein